MKILILRLSSLGDVVLCQPVCAWLREKYPEAQIDFVTKRHFLELVSLMGCELNPIQYHKRPWFHLRLRNTKYDIVIDLHGKLNSYLVSIATGAKVYRYDKQRHTRLQIVKGNKSLAISSTVDLYASALRYIQSNVTLSKPLLQIPLGYTLPLVPENKKLVALFPGAAHFTKTYPLVSYKEILRDCHRDIVFWLLGSKAESDLCGKLHYASKENTVDLSGKLDMPALVSAIAKADLIISSDSGPMHIAAALNKQQIAIFGATHPRLGFAPLNDKAEILCAELDCQPCSLHGGMKCPLGHLNCMKAITAKQVMGRMENILKF